MDTRESGRIGGQRRAAKLTPQARSEIARQAAHARWAKVSPEQRSEALRKAVSVRWERARSSGSESLGSEIPQQLVRGSDQIDRTESLAQHALQRLRAIKARAEQLLFEKTLLTSDDWQREAFLASGFSLLTTEFLRESERFLDAQHYKKAIRG